MDEVTKAFLDAGGVFAALLERDEVAARWDEPSTMKDYTVGDLAGHVTVATVPLESALERPPPADLKVIRLGRYYAGMRIAAPEDLDKPIHGAMQALSHTAARDGAEVSADRFRSLFERLGKRLPGEEADRLLDLRPVVPIAIRLEDFVRTRVIELVVHTDDLAVSVGVDPPQPSPAAANVVIEALMATVRAGHGDLSVIRALTRGERSDAAVFPVL